MGPKIIIAAIVENEKGTVQFARGVQEILKIGDTVLLYGDLGSGKTFLVKEIVKCLGIREEVSSPSFSIINQYSRKDFTINHIDLYRIKNPADLSNLGLEDFWQGPYLNFIEWPQLIEKTIKWPHYRISIETDDRSARQRKFSLLKC
jgi:tRNA threonylcarbamoyladenosine biosynthesis protein TsaE